ncbi:hypothetical protein H5410_005255, partial [Solanum commersonii]
MGYPVYELSCKVRTLTGKKEHNKLKNVTALWKETQSVIGMGSRRIANQFRDDKMDCPRYWVNMGSARESKSYTQSYPSSSRRVDEI